MTDEFRGRRETRERFLRRLYDLSETGESEYCDAYELGEELALSRHETERVVRYHEDHGYVAKTGRSGLVIRITARGIDHVETGGGA